MKKENFQESLYENFLSYDIHIGGLEKNLNFATKAYVEEIVENRCVLDMTQTYVSLNRVQQYLCHLHEHEKKVLFIGTPKNLKKELFDLCAQYKHYCVETWFYGLFTNFSRAYQKKRKSLLHISERPSLIFVFDLSQYNEVKKEALRLEIPIMAFVSSDDNIENIDYPIAGNVKSVKGGMFVLNFFSQVLREAEEAKEQRKKELEEAKKRRELLKLKRQTLLKLKRERLKKNARRKNQQRQTQQGKNYWDKNSQKGKAGKKDEWHSQKKTFSPHKTSKENKSFRFQSQQVKKN
jgi:ribosomal protein S2